MWYCSLTRSLLQALQMYICRLNVFTGKKKKKEKNAFTNFCIKLLE